MKRGKFLFCILMMFLLFVIPFAVADDNETTSDNEQSKIDKAYDCLEEKIKDKCSSLSLEEKIFSVLATGDCKSELLDEERNDECWPESDCSIKSTAQAILALNNVNTNTNDEKEWLLDQTTTPSEIDWFLQIESSGQTTCTISYSGASYQIIIDEDKTINSGAGSCLSLSEGGWWLRISSGCYGEEFEIKCHESSFLTNFLFKKTTSSVIHVSEKTTSASAEASTYEKVNSLCFAESSDCDYEGSLWAALVLNYLDEDISAFLPYLVAMADENQDYLPEAFLYLLTDEFRVDLLSKQISDKYWDVSGDKFYDTALALYPISDEPREKTNAENWLLEVQDKDGCWQGNIRNTAFILASIWPKGILESEDSIDCEDSGHYCISSINCQENGGNELDYSCSGMFVCCDREQILESCDEQGGEVCNSAQRCKAGTTVDASDLDYGEQCCVGGRCEEPEEESTCERNFGICRTSDCNNDEEESLTYDCDYGDTCCITKTISDKKSYWWIWLLAILIILTILGIIYKEKLRPFWFKVKSKFSKFGKSKPGPKTTPVFPPASSRIPLRRTTPRRILPPTKQRQVRRLPSKRPKGELDEVLKKLKEMGK